MQGDSEGKLRGASHRRPGQPSPDATMGERSAVILRRTAGMRAALGVASPGGGYFFYHFAEKDRRIALSRYRSAGRSIRVSLVGL